MQLKVGVDAVEIERIERELDNEAFWDRVHVPNERPYYESRRQKAQSLAAAFAAKEAFTKALGTGLRGFSLREVEVLHDGLGAPHYAFSGKAAEKVAELGLSFELSLTHTGTTAVAVAVAVGE